MIYNWIEDYNVEKIKNDLWIARLAYIGRLSPLKWVDILLKSINELKKAWINNFKLDIIWDWEEYENLSNYIKENKLDKNKYDLIEQFIEYLCSNVVGQRQLETEWNRSLPDLISRESIIRDMSQMLQHKDKGENLFYEMLASA